jgi:hypothetical protein
LEEKDKEMLQVDGYLKWISINGIRYDHDIVIHTDGSITRRDEEASIPYQSDYFHIPLSESELDFIERERPEKVIVGAGYRGMLPLTPNAKALLKQYNLVERLTPDAMEMLRTETSRYIAIMHIRC